MFSKPLFQFDNFGSKIPDDCQVIFVADLFVDDYVGGAELTSQALIDSSPLKIFKLKSQLVNLEHLKQGKNKYWIFGNFSALNPELIPNIIKNLKYSILEYDYKYCRYRSPEKHLSETGKNCDCDSQLSGKIISSFFYGAKSLYWMSEGQKNHYLNLFPFLLEKDNVVLSSVFDPKTLGIMKTLREKIPSSERSGWIVLGSNSWVKGFEAAKKWCEENSKSYEIVWNLPYESVIAKLASSEGFVYLPAGKDTCPRMVIEAKLLGCKLHLNENVQHKDEEWFSTDDLDSINDYLLASRQLFWNSIKKIIDYKPKISGYTTVYNCEKQGYPYLQAINSMIGFCDEVCVVDGGSSDGTWEKLQALAGNEPKLKLKQINRDWSHPRHAIYDGMQKAEARSMCTGDFCWQMDSDEVVHEDDFEKIVELCKNITPDIDIVSLPVIEYWGGPDKVRADIQPWKWRLSRNKSNITHGVPIELRTVDSNGHPMAKVGTDGCDMIDSRTGNRIPHISFYTDQVEHVRLSAMMGSRESLGHYENWFNNVVNNLPCVFHYSWYDLPRKIRLYRDYWQNHWNALWGKDTSDTLENNMMFDVPWSQVTDQMIIDRSKDLSEKTGGWIWHRKWDGKMTTPHIICNRTQPKIMREK
jgi:glycosyltransferase involved in cell wall biosynthesis